MRVSQILKSKSDLTVVTEVPGTTLGEAAKTLAARRIGTVVISADGARAEGILSERDIVRVLARKGGAGLSDTVEAHMTAELVTCAPGDDADAALAAMTKGRFRHMPVLDGGKLVGLITLGDVVKARLAEVSMEKDALEGMIMGH
ncbi:MAG: CBS domain-containing protein [Pseudomonadota bacterium]